jgi:hypothetical protein
MITALLNLELQNKKTNLYCGIGCMVIGGYLNRYQLILKHMKMEEPNLLSQIQNFNN